MFASRVTKDVQITVSEEVAAWLGASVVVVTCQKLSGRSLDKAKDARSAAQLGSLRAASKDLLQVMKSDQVEAAAEKLAAQRAKEATDLKAKARARFDAYDREHVLLAGIVRWSCQEKVPLSPENVGDLDEQAAQELHEEILTLSLPPVDPLEAAALGKDA